MGTHVSLDSGRWSTEHQVRALTCLTEICQEEDFEKMGYHGLAEKVEEKLNVLKFICRFEKLQLPFDHKAFVAQDKQVRNKYELKFLSSIIFASVSPKTVMN